MKDLLHTLFSASQFIPHGHCYLWKPELVGLHLVSDVLTAIAYYSIPITLTYFVQKRQDIPFNWLFVLFSAFIVACGTTHLLAVWTLWHPVYWLSGVLKCITAIISVYTAIGLIFILPKALALPGLAVINQALEAEIAERQKTEIALQESEERFRSTFEQAAVGIAHVSLSGQFLRLNQRFCEIAGYPPSELQALTFQEITHPDDLASDLKQAHDLLNGKIQTYTLEKRYIRKDRSLVWIYLTASLVRDRAGEAKYFIAVIEDISKRKSIELALQHSEATLKLFVKYAPAGIAMLDINLRYVFVSQRWTEDYRLGPIESIIGQSHYTIFPEVPDRWRQINQRCLAGAIERCEEDLFERADGTQQWIRWEVRPWYTTNQDIGGIIIFSENITERKQAETNLQVSEERLRLALAAANQGIFDDNLQTGEVVVNSSYATMLEYDPTEFREFTVDWRERLHPDDRETAFRLYQDYITGQIPEYRSEFRLKTKSGEWKWILSLGKIVAWDESGQPLRMLGTHTDITDRKQAEASLSQLAAIVESSTDAIISKTLDGVIMSWNAGAEALFGYTAEEAIGQSVFLLIPSELNSEESCIQEKLRCGEIISPYETVRQHKDGRLIDISLTISPLKDMAGRIMGASKIARDVSVRKQIEAERLQTEKLRLELQLLENILEVTLAGYWDWNIPENQEYLSPTFKRMFGYDEHELPNTPETWQRLIFAEDLPGVLDCFDRHINSRGQVPFYNEVRYRHKNGSTVWVICSGRVIEWDYAGNPVRMVGCHIDITRRKLAEAQLQTSEMELRALFAAMTDTVVVRDREGRCLKIAPNSYRLYRDPVEMVGSTLHDILPQPEADLVLTKIRECLEQHTTTSAEYSLTIQGRPVYFSANISPLSADTVIVVARDMSDRHYIEASLRRFERIVSSVTDGIALLDCNYTYQIVNQAYLTWCNKSQSEVVGHTVREIVGPDLFDSFIRPQFDRCLAGETIQYERWFDYPNVVPQFLSVTYVPYLDVDQTIAGIIVSLRDITVLKQTGESLRISEERLQLALEGSGDGLWDWNIATGNVYFSSLWQTMLGYADGELPHHVGTWERLIHPEDKPWVMDQLNTHLKDGSTSYAFDYRVLTKSGEWKWVANYGKVVARDQQGTPLRMVGTHKDISDRKQAEEQLRLSSERLSLANSELARAARLKDEFLAGMSHELRTPLNAILGLSEALLEEVYGGLTPEQRSSLQTVEKSGQHLLALINDILDLSKIESGKMELELNAIGLRSLCDSCLTFVKQQASHKQIKLSCQIAEGLNTLEADERRLRQVLVNLLSNAVKFTPDQGSVVLQVTADPVRETIEFSVTDTGIGIAPENMARLFQPFVQLDSSLSRRYEGTGLGLSLVRRIMDLHGGSVSLESEVGRGSCFTIALPWKPLTDAASSIAPALPQPMPPNIERVLIVEDSEAAAKQMIRYLTDLGAQTIVQAQGEGALETAIHSQPDVIILDILLPDQTGWEVLIELKAHPATKAIPVIVISVIDSRARGLELGASDCLVKPITRPQFQQALSRVLTTAQPVAPAPVSGHSSTSSLILLAEDNEANIAAINLYLQAHGLQLVIARNGLEAIQMAQHYQPALILMDIQMPEMDGLEAISRIRSDTNLSQIPIIALTALAMPGDRERCLTTGANEYMTKPVSLKQLLNRISAHVAV